MAALTSERLIVFTRFPEPGKTKTRLIPALGELGAADLQRRMTEYILSAVAAACKQRRLTIAVYYEGGDAGLMRDWLGPQFIYRPQGSGNLGRRMDNAFQEAFRTGIEAVVIVGSDIPGISANIIQQAFEGLQKNNLVLGPAHDGGYYLIGIQRAAAHRANPQLFEGIKWGSDEVLAQTIQIAGTLRLNIQLLEYLADVDRPEDLHFWPKLNKSATH